METQQLSSNVVLIKVPSIEAVNNFQVPSGASVSFMHNSKPYMFIKTAPPSPFEQPVVEIFKITKVDSMDDDTNSNGEENFVTRKEYEELKRSLRSLEERLTSNEPIYRKSKKWSGSGKSSSKTEPTK